MTILMENGFCEVNSIHEKKIGGHHQIPKITFEVSVDTLARHQMLECGGLGSSDFFGHNTHVVFIWILRCPGLDLAYCSFYRQMK